MTDPDFLLAVRDLLASEERWMKGGATCDAAGVAIDALPCDPDFPGYKWLAVSWCLLAAQPGVVHYLTSPSVATWTSAWVAAGERLGLTDLPCCSDCPPPSLGWDNQS